MAQTSSGRRGMKGFFDFKMLAGTLFYNGQCRREGLHGHDLARTASLVETDIDVTSTDRVAGGSGKFRSGLLYLGVRRTVAEKLKKGHLFRGEMKKAVHS